MSAKSYPSSITRGMTTLFKRHTVHLTPVCTMEAMAVPCSHPTRCLRCGASGLHRVRYTLCVPSLEFMRICDNCCREFENPG